MKIPDKFFTSDRLTNKKLKNRIPVLLVTALILLILALAAALYQLPHTEDERFKTFTKKMFLTEVQGNTLNLHYTLADPSACGIEDYPVTLGSMDRDSHVSSLAMSENYLVSLHQFHPEELSPKNRLTFEILSEYLNTCREGADWYLYEEPLSPTLGIQAQLPVLLAEYTFRTRRDIEDYLTLLTRIPDYFQSITDFEKEKSRAGLFMSDICVKDILEQCSSFVKSGKENYLKQVFDDQIDSITNLTADEKISYKQQNANILSAYVLPAYENLMNQLAKLMGTGKNTGGLCFLPHGKAYYEYLVRTTTGDASSIENLEKQIKEKIISDYKEIRTLMKSRTGMTSASLEHLELPDPSDTLVGLKQMISRDFPAAPDVTCQIKFVHDSLEDYLSPAFYLIPPIDASNRNVIYINRSGNYNALELYTTLAHEGYPGHLYQTVSFEAQNDEPLRSILSFGGYTEGWATYAEMYAYTAWEQNHDLAALYQKDRSFMLGIASLLDIGIHYHGYSRTEVASFLKKFGITESTSDTLYTAILEAPANYLKYYIGYLNFLNLRTFLQQQLGEHFSLKEYHARVLAIGPCSFPILKKYLTDREYLENIS